MPNQHGPKFPERFDDNVIPEPMSGCHLWIGCVNRYGYGKIRVNGRQIAASRAAWIAAKGAIPPGLWVLHRCDNPPCVNPDHLFLGDRTANTRDMIAKGRDRGVSTLCRAMTHCKRGHPFNERNTVRRKTGRECRACREITNAARRPKRLEYWKQHNAAKRLVHAAPARGEG